MWLYILESYWMVMRGQVFEGQSFQEKLVVWKEIEIWSYYMEILILLIQCFDCLMIE